MPKIQTTKSQKSHYAKKCSKSQKVPLHYQKHKSEQTNPFPLYNETTKGVIKKFDTFLHKSMCAIYARVNHTTCANPFSLYYDWLQ